MCVNEHASESHTRLFLYSDDNNTNWPYLCKQESNHTLLPKLSVLKLLKCTFYRELDKLFKDMFRQLSDRKGFKSYNNNHF